MSRPTRKRCAACGRECLPIHVDGRPLWCRTEHPAAGTIDWTRQLGVAWNYLVRESGKGSDLERWIESADELEHLNSSKGDLALALSYARRWNLTAKHSAWGVLLPINLSGLPVIEKRLVSLFGNGVRA